MLIKGAFHGGVRSYVSHGMIRTEYNDDDDIEDGDDDHKDDKVAKGDFQRFKGFYWTTQYCGSTSQIFNSFVWVVSLYNINT